MNRLIIIGNGFDLAHGLKTSYKDFIYWYWKQRVTDLHDVMHNTSNDTLCNLEIIGATWSSFYFQNNMYLNNADGKELYYFLNNHKDAFIISNTPFFENIHKALETKRWVDIENEYYKLLMRYALTKKSEEVAKLNLQLEYIKEKLIEYLTQINAINIQPKTTIRTKIYAPINKNEVAIEWQQKLKEYIDWSMKQGKDYWKKKYGDSIAYSDIDEYKLNPKADYPRCFMTPDNIMLLNFNYTRTAGLYVTNRSNVTLNYIHGNLNNPESIIFGYGDELDRHYQDILERNDNESLKNVKSVKYLETRRYREMLEFIQSAPFQVFIMGHSCGISDRTLLNTVFEHENCVSIKPFFHKWENGSDNYLDIVQNISRCFTNMKLFRDRVVNKEQCLTM